MPKAYNLLLKVVSAELKYEANQPVAKEPFCKVSYGKYFYMTKTKPEGDDKTPRWKDQFDIVYYEKVGFLFTLLDGEGGAANDKEVCKGELDIAKKLGTDGEIEIPLKAPGAKPGEFKKAGILKVHLKWLGDFELTPYRLELVVHTADLSKIDGVRRMGLFGMNIGMNDGTLHSTPEIQANNQGHCVFKDRFKAVITTQETITLKLVNSELKNDGIDPPQCVISIDSVKKTKPGLMKKFHLESKLNAEELKVVNSPVKLAQYKKEGKLPPTTKRLGSVYVLINHNYKPRLDPKDPTSAPVAPGTGQPAPQAPGSPGPNGSTNPLNNSTMSSPSLGTLKFHDPSMNKLELRKKIYEEFKFQKKEKVSLVAMDDATKETYLKSQEEAIVSLRSHRLQLRDHLETLEDKLDDTLARIREKKREENKVNPDEDRRRKEMDEKVVVLRELKEEAKGLKDQFVGGSGFDKLKELENKFAMKAKKVKGLKVEVKNLKENIEKKALAVHDIEVRNREENDRLTLELHKVREEVRKLEREADKRSDVSKSINAASLLLEKEYRELCKKHKINDVLNVRTDKDDLTGEYKFKEFDPTRAKSPPSRGPDKRMKNPIWRAM